MANPCNSMALVSLGSYMADTTLDLPQPSLSRQIRNDPDGPLAILWDIENCPIPSDVRPEDVAGNIRMALRVHPIIKGAVLSFSAFGDFNAFPRRLREGCQRTGVKLVDVPNGRKDAADKAILVDMFLFALDNPPPSSIMLISGDVDFSPALHILGQRGYTIILVIPNGVGVSSALCNAGKFVWDWPSVARGEGFVPPKSLIFPRSLPNDSFISGYGSYHMSENPGGQIQIQNQNQNQTQLQNQILNQNQNEEESIVYRGMSQSFGISQSITEYNSSCTGLSYYPSTARSNFVPPSALTEAASDLNDPTLWVQPGDFNGLKMQLVRLLELSGGSLPLIRVPADYQKLFGRPLYISEYGSVKLMDLFKRMGDILSVDGKGQKRFVYLKNNPTRDSPPSSIPTSSSIKKGKIVQEESSDEFSDEEQRKKDDSDSDTEQRILDFKFELQEILVSYSCRIFLSYFEDIYEQRYKRRLDLRSLGVDGLEELFGKMSDVVTLHEEPLYKRKFIAAVIG